MKKVFMSLAIVAAMFAASSCACNCCNSKDAGECCKESCTECTEQCDEAKCAECDENCTECKDCETKCEDCDKANTEDCCKNKAE